MHRGKSGFTPACSGNVKSPQVVVGLSDGHLEMGVDGCLLANTSDVLEHADGNRILKLTIAGTLSLALTLGPFLLRGSLRNIKPIFVRVSSALVEMSGQILNGSGTICMVDTYTW